MEALEILFYSAPRGFYYALFNANVRQRWPLVGTEMRLIIFSAICFGFACVAFAGMVLL